MAVTVFKTAPRCKICQNPKRSEVDALLERRAKGESDKDGNRINEAYVLAQMAEWGFKNPNAENIKSHWGKDEAKKHSYFSAALTEEDKKALEEELAAAIDAEVRAVCEEIVPGWFDNPHPLRKDDYLELVMNLSALELKRKARNGQALGVTVDQALKSIDSSTRRNANEATNDLIRMLGSAVNKRLPAPAKALIPAVIDVEPIAEEDDDVPV